MPAVAQKRSWDDFPLHQCYWNDRFAMALEQNMPHDKKRLGAWCAVSNGINNYWEWRTHRGYDIAALIEKHCGIRCEHTPITNTGGLGGATYSRLKDENIHALCKHFNLPTTNFGDKTILTPDEQRERDDFNRQYPYTKVL